MPYLLAGTKKKELHFQTLLLAFCVAAAFFIPYIIYGKGYFLFYGDFNVQQVPFYQLCHEAVKSGNIGWNWGTDLGANFIGSYSFYLLGSPFFWLTLPFPNSFVPHLMGPLLILKFSLAAFFAYFYIRRFVRNPESAMLGGLLYAFCGFSIYNIFFNHFHEAIVIFPLLLLSMELHITEKRRGVFALAVFGCAFINYFFFYGMVVFCILYWAIRSINKCWKQNIKSFLTLAFEAVIGLLMAMVILYPTILAVLQNNRLSDINLGYDSWLYGRVQIYANILEIFFFPPDIPARPVFFPEADIKWSSMGAWLPLFSMVGVFAWFKAKKKHWINKLLTICAVMALVPILNSAFYMFNSAYYARWFFMPILIMCLSTVMAIEDHRVEWNGAFKVVSFITIIATLIIGFWPQGKDENGDITQFGLYTYDADSAMYTFRFWITCAIAIISLIILGILLKLYRSYHKVFLKNAISFVCIISVIYSALFIGFGSSHSYDIKNEVIPNLIEGSVTLDGDKDDFRIDCYDCMDNTAMFLDYSGINAFHSIVPGSIVEFYEYIGEERSVASRPTVEPYSLRSFLSVKYLLSRAEGDEFIDDYGDPAIYGFEFLKKENGFNIYENKNYIPIGFTYDNYITEADCENVPEHLKTNMMLKAILLNKKQIKKYGSLLENINSKDYTLSEFSFEIDCKTRNQNSVYDFERTKTGFRAAIDLEKDNLVFFSVPYEKGWSAFVNGKKVDVEKVNIGFMAVKGEKGTNEIEFVYKTPGLYEGIIISVIALVILICYMVLVKYKRGRKPINTDGLWPEGDELKEYFKENPLIEFTKEDIEEAEKQITYEEEDEGETEINLDAIKKFIENDEN